MAVSNKPFPRCEEAIILLTVVLQWLHFPVNRFTPLFVFRIVTFDIVRFLLHFKPNRPLPLLIIPMLDVLYILARYVVIVRPMGLVQSARSSSVHSVSSASRYGDSLFIKNFLKVRSKFGCRRRNAFCSNM